MAISQSKREYNHAYYLKNKKRIKKANSSYYKTNRERVNRYHQLWRKENPEKVKRHHLTNKDKWLEYGKKWRRLNREQQSAYHKQYRANNADRIRIRNREFIKNNREKVRKQRTIYNRRYLQRNLSARIRARLRCRFGQAVRLGYKSSSVTSLLGCSIGDFKIYLESLFQSGMSWDNYGIGKGKWNLDHIMPCAIFDLTKPEHQKRCFHFSNMQPMWSDDNMRKSDKVSDNQYRLL